MSSIIIKPQARTLLKKFFDALYKDYFYCNNGMVYFENNGGYKNRHFPDSISLEGYYLSTFDINTAFYNDGDLQCIIHPTTIIFEINPRVPYFTFPRKRLGDAEKKAGQLKGIKDIVSFSYHVVALPIAIPYNQWCSKFKTKIDVLTFIQGISIPPSIITSDGKDVVALWLIKNGKALIHKKDLLKYKRITLPFEKEPRSSLFVPRTMYVPFTNRDKEKVIIEKFSPELRYTIDDLECLFQTISTREVI